MKREKYRLTTEDFLERAKKVHGDKYDYSKTVYKNKRTKIIIHCKVHDVDFEQAPMRHLLGQGCPICGKIKAQKREGDFKNKRKTTEEFKKDLYKLYGNKYELLSDYINNKTKVKIFCHNKNTNGKEHGIFYIKPNDLICGHGCKRCAYSNLEKEIETFLQENNIQYEQQKTFNDWLGAQRLDFYLPEYNIAIECQGRQHFEAVDFAGSGKTWAEEQFVHVKKLDENKFNKCKEHNIPILYYSNERKNEEQNLFNNKQKLLEKIKNYESTKER